MTLSPSPPFALDPLTTVVQLATTDGVIHVVDCRTLEQQRRGSITELLSDVVQKSVILHSADADLKLVYLWTQSVPVSVFDTQV